MKKFLTVLLALSVVFTYSFSAVGTVFAANTEQDKADAAVAAAQKDAEKKITDYAATLVYNQQGILVDPSDVGANLTKAAVDAGVSKAIADKKIAILEAAIAGMEDGQWDAATDGKTVTDLVPADDDAIKTLVFTTNLAAIYDKAITDAKADVTATLNAATTDGYTKADAKTIADAKTVAKAAIDAVTTKDAAGLAAVAKAKDDFVKAVKDLKTITVQENELADAKAQAKKDLASAIDTAKAAAKAEYEETIADKDEDPANIATANARLATLNTDMNKIAAFYEAQIDEVKLAVEEAGALATAKAAVTGVVTTATNELGDYVSIVNKLATKNLLIEYATNYATGLKNQFDKNTGLPVYNSATVDAALNDVIAKINKLDATVDTYGKIETELAKTKNAAAEAAELATAKTTAEGAITTGDYASSKWDNDNKTAVEAIQEEYVAKIKAADSATAIDAVVKEAKEKMDAIPTTQTLSDQQTYVATLIADANHAYATKLAAYAAGVQAKNPGVYDDATVAKVVAAAVASFGKAVADKNAVLTNDEMKAIVEGNYNAALAMIDGMKSTAQLDAAAKAVVDAIAALPTVPTLETKAQYLNVQKMLEEYAETPGSDVATKITNKVLLTSYMKRIVNLEKTAVEDMVKALPANPTAADEAAVEAAKAAYDAYKEAYSKYGSGDYNYGYDVINNAAALTAAATAVSDAKLTDAAKKVAALPVEITMDDKAAVEAARAAYDALTDAEKASFNKDLLAKLVAAEKVIAMIAPTVETLKITASSTAAKGSITVKWTVKGDTTAADGFEVFRSVKKNSGFTNKAFYTTDNNAKRTYKNTKSLKKGTRYYYKVRAYKVLADGTKLYSDWSNKAYRIAK